MDINQEEAEYLLKLITQSLADVDDTDIERYADMLSSARLTISLVTKLARFLKIRGLADKHRAIVESNNLSMLLWAGLCAGSKQVERAQTVTESNKET